MVLIARDIMKGDKDHGGFKGCSKKKWQSRGPIKKSKTEKESSPFNVFMKAELARLKKVREWSFVLNVQCASVGLCEHVSMCVFRRVHACIGAYPLLCLLFVRDVSSTALCFACEIGAGGQTASTGAPQDEECFSFSVFPRLALSYTYSYARTNTHTRIHMHTNTCTFAGGPGDGREDFQKESYLGVDCNTKRQMSPATYFTPEWDM